MIDPAEPQTSEPLGTPQRLAGIELQLVRLNAQLRTVTRWIRIRETIGIVSRLVAFGLAIFVALALTQFLRELKDRPLFGPGTSIESLQDRLKGLELPNFGE